MATRYPTFNNRPNFSYITPQNQQTTLTPLNRNNQRQSENSENQNNWINNQNFLAMAGNLAGNLDWKTLLGMAFGFGLLNPMQKLFDRDKKQATGADSINTDVILGQYPKTELVLDTGEDSFFNPEALNQEPQPQNGKYDFSYNGLLGNPETIYKTIKRQQSAPASMLLQYSGGNWGRY